LELARLTENRSINRARFDARLLQGGHDLVFLQPNPRRDVVRLDAIRRDQQPRDAPGRRRLREDGARPEGRDEKTRRNETPGRTCHALLPCTANRAGVDGARGFIASTATLPVPHGRQTILMPNAMSFHDWSRAALPPRRAALGGPASSGF
jgi:hypothetical protein